MSFKYPRKSGDENWMDDIVVIYVTLMSVISIEFSSVPLSGMSPT